MINYNDYETALFTQTKFIKTGTSVRKWVTYTIITSLIPLTFLFIAWVGPHHENYDAGLINPWGLLAVCWILFLVFVTEWLTVSLQEKRLWAKEDFKKTHPQLAKFLE